MDINLSGKPVEVCRIFCIGRNYAAHAKELNDDIPECPIVFSKFPTCLLPEGNDIVFPDFGKELHHEVEVVVLIGKQGKATTPKEAEAMIGGLGMGLDLTMRDVQAEHLAKAWPWETSKGFESSAPIGEFTAYDPAATNIEDIEFDCKIDGEVRQHGNTRNMIFPISTLIMELSKVWTLCPGDLIYTGTPEGIGPVNKGQTITISGMGKTHSWKVV